MSTAIPTSRIDLLDEPVYVVLSTPMPVEQRVIYRIRPTRVNAFAVE